MEKRKRKFSGLSGKKLKFKKDIVFRKLRGRGVVVQTKRAKILVLNETGADVLRFIEMGLSEKEIMREMSKIYSGDIKEIRKGVKEIIKELTEKGVIEKI